MIAVEVKLEKIDDVAVANSVVQVTECTPKDESKRHLEKSVSYRTADAVDNDDNDSHNREQRQQDRLGRRTDGREDSERHSGVPYIRNIKKTVYYGDRLI